MHTVNPLNKTTFDKNLELDIIYSSTLFCLKIDLHIAYNFLDSKLNSVNY